MNHQHVNGDEAANNEQYQQHHQQQEQLESFQNVHVTLGESKCYLQSLVKNKIQNDFEIQTCLSNLESIFQQVEGLWDHLPIDLTLKSIPSSSTSNSSIWIDMIYDCIRKACALSVDMLHIVTTGQIPHSTAESNSISTVIDFGLNSQACIARIFELTIRLLYHESEFIQSFPNFNSHTNSTSETSISNDNLQQKLQPIIQQYAEYQRQVLRNRSKPSISHIAQLRKISSARKHNLVQLVWEQYERQKHDDDLAPTNLNQLNEDEDNSNDEEQKRFRTQPYAHAITVILGEGSTLIHPLLMWSDGINATKQSISPSSPSSTIRTTQNNEFNIQNTLYHLCQTTIYKLHNEVQTLSITIGEWMINDTLDSNATSLYSNNLFVLDKTLDEMAFVCQVIQRYCTFSSTISMDHDPHSSNQDTSKTTTTTTSSTTTNTQSQHDNSNKISRHLQEQSLQYSTLESKLLHYNIQKAYQLAQPVEIILGTQQYVPSIVEDAYYFSTCAMERASSTLCPVAICSILNSICELWNLERSSTNSSRAGDDVNSTSDHVNHTIYSALMDQIGCQIIPKDTTLSETSTNTTTTTTNGHSHEKINTKIKSPPRSGGSLFATKLLGALDLIETTDNGIKSYGNDHDPKSKKTGPSSSQQKFDLRQIQLDTQLCTLNGIHSASLACTGLSSLFDSLLPNNDEDENDNQNTNNNVQSCKTDSNHNSKSNHDPSAMMIQFAKEQLHSHSKSYMILLHDQVRHLISEWCGIVSDTSQPPPLIASLPSSPCLHQLYFNLSQERYNLDATAFDHAEKDERLEHGLLCPLKESRLVLELEKGKCDEGVVLAITQLFSAQVVSLILGTILKQNKQFTDWGSLLLSKQMRLFENFFCSLIWNGNLDRDGDQNHDSITKNNGNIINGHHSIPHASSASSSDAKSGNTLVVLKEFQKLNQAVTILQLEKPSDWALYSYEVGEDVNHNLSKDDIRLFMKLRIDFSEDAIHAVCGNS